MLSPALTEAVTAALGEEIDVSVPLGGGCINHGTRLETRSGKSYFLKWNDRAPPEMFEAEVDGLEALRRSTVLTVPEPLACGGGDGSPSWLVMEHVAAGSPAADFDARLGEGLAALHASADVEAFGWHRDNWIGSLGQENTQSPEWALFWRDRRLAPQLAAAREQGFLDDDIMDRVQELVGAALADVTTPDLLHGDLWSGNMYAGVDGGPVIIDPAVYAGHGEVDLAMTELFGGFDERFYQAYAAAANLGPEYHAFRRDLYQLYYLLVHVNLFGASYVAGCLTAANRVVGELS